MDISPSMLLCFYTLLPLRVIWHLSFLMGSLNPIKSLNAKSNVNNSAILTRSAFIFLKTKDSSIATIGLFLWDYNIFKSLILFFISWKICTFFIYTYAVF